MRYRFAAGFARGRRVLDAACGTGYGSRLMKDAGARQVTSIDLSADAFEGLYRIGAGAGLLLARGDVSRLPLADGCCDLYTSFETLEHVEDDEGLVAEARRVLGSQGVFLCSTPNRELLSPGNRLEDRPENPYHVREYSISEFRDLLESFFPEVELFGQTWFSNRHARRLARAGARSNHRGVRLHQLRNVIGLPFERPARHEPRPIGARGVPEVVIGVCRNARLS